MSRDIVTLQTVASIVLVHCYPPVPNGVSITGDKQVHQLLPCCYHPSCRICSNWIIVFHQELASQQGLDYRRDAFWTQLQALFHHSKSLHVDDRSLCFGTFVAFGPLLGEWCWFDLGGGCLTHSYGWHRWHDLGTNAITDETWPPWGYRATRWCRWSICTSIHGGGSFSDEHSTVPKGINQFLWWTMFTPFWKNQWHLASKSVFQCWSMSDVNWQFRGPFVVWLRKPVLDMGFQSWNIQDFRVALLAWRIKTVIHRIQAGEIPNWQTWLVVHPFL